MAKREKKEPKPGKSKIKGYIAGKTFFASSSSQKEEFHSLID